MKLGMLQGLLARGSRHANDLSCLTAHDVKRFDGALPPGLELEWLGTAGFRLGYQGTQLLIDPYLTRPSLTATFARGPLRPNPTLLARLLPRIDAVLVGHTHFDHALDVPAIAQQHAARVYGARSLVHLMGLHGLAAQAVEVQPRRLYAIGPFEVTFVESTHSKLIAGLAVPFDGEFTCNHLDGLRSSAFRCGEVRGIHITVAGVSFYHQGSADLLDDRIEHRGVDYFLCGIAGRAFARDYTRRVLSRLEPRVIIPHHFDDFFRPVDAELGFSLNVNLGGFLDEVRRVSESFEVRTLRPLQTWSGP
jgi:L-ascorbate metabolism protein UlaG (beta-lactamase superfamily)